MVARYIRVSSSDNQSGQSRNADADQIGKRVGLLQWMVKLRTITLITTRNFVRAIMPMIN